MWSRFLREMLFTLYGTAAVLLGPITAQGATYVVATTGNDSNPGTLSQPFKSFAQGVSRLQPGDTLYIRGGLYTEQIDLQGPNKTGIAGNYITIAGYPGEKVIIRYTDPVDHAYGPVKARGNRGYFVFENLILDMINGTNLSGWALRDGNHHFILRNLEIMNPKYNAIFIGANDIQIISCKIHDALPATGSATSYYYGIYGHHGSNWIIEGNEIYNNSGGGVHLYPGPMSNVIVRNNSIHDNNYRANSVAFGGLIVYGSLTAPILNTQIYNNLVYNNGSSPTAGNGDGISINIHTRGTKVWNNTVYGNKGRGIIIRSSITTIDTVLQNNIVVGNTGGQIVNGGIDSILSHNLITDPRFVNTDASNFRLQPGSPAIDKGMTLSEVQTDIRGISRPQGLATAYRAYDIGAYEEGTDGTAPLSPKNLIAR